MTEANFSYADIQGADFSEANLREANFHQAKAGLKSYGIFVFSLFLLLIAGLSGFTAGIAITFATYFFLSLKPNTFTIFLASFLFICFIRTVLNVTCGPIAVNVQLVAAVAIVLAVVAVGAPAAAVDEPEAKIGGIVVSGVMSMLFVLAVALNSSVTGNQALSTRFIGDGILNMVMTALERPSFYANNYKNQGDTAVAGDRNINTSGGNYIERNERDYIQGNYYAAGQPQSLAQAAAEIQVLLKQLEQTYPTTTTLQQMVVAAEAINRIESKPTFKKRVINAVKEGGLAAFEKAIDNPAGAFIVGAIKGWQEVEAED